MTTATELPPPAMPTPNPRPDTVADLLHRLGDVPPDRIRMDPPPGQATFEDLVRVNELRDGQVCEWVENTLVEKAMGFNESWLAVIIIGRFDAYLQAHDIGMLTAPDGVMKILPGIGRAPDVSFLSWKSLPGGKPPPVRGTRCPALCPTSRSKC